MTAGRYDITIEQGATFVRTFYAYVDGEEAEVGNELNLTGYSARMKIKDKDGTEIASLTSGSGITLGGAAGTVAISITAAATAAYDFEIGVYDLELVNGSTVQRLVQGDVWLSPEVTTT